MFRIAQLSLFFFLMRALLASSGFTHCPPGTLISLIIGFACADGQQQPCQLG